MKTFFTSDTHFFHQNAIKYCNRPFKYADEMNEVLIKNWNDTVSDNDEIYHLGDFSFSGPDKTEAIVCRLKGKKYLIRGNHDHKNVLKRLEQYFIWIKDVYMLTVQDPNPHAPDKHMSVHPTKNQMIWLAHYAHKVWPQSHYGVWHFYGHSHGMIKEDPKTLALDVGVDCFNYKPVAYEEVKNIMKGRAFTPHKPQ